MQDYEYVTVLNGLSSKLQCNLRRADVNIPVLNFVDYVPTIRYIYFYCYLSSTTCKIIVIINNSEWMNRITNNYNELCYK